jgi:hypothetical protein
VGAVYIALTLRQQIRADVRRPAAEVAEPAHPTAPEGVMGPEAAGLAVPVPPAATEISSEIQGTRGGPDGFAPERGRR